MLKFNFFGYPCICKFITSKSSIQFVYTYYILHRLIINAFSHIFESREFEYII